MLSTGTRATRTTHQPEFAPAIIVPSATDIATTRPNGARSRTGVGGDALHFEFVPAGLMSWFLVRTHRYSQRQHWREGARLVYAGQQAHIELDTQQREISIKVWGSFPYTFLLILKQTLDVLLQSFQGLRVRRKIPCRCSLQQQSPHYHVYEDLEKQQARGQSEIVCPEGLRISLATLLYGIHTSTAPEMVATVQKTQQFVTRRKSLGA